MHEMSLAAGVLQIIEEHSVQHGFQRVSAVFLEVGELAGVEVEALRFAFDAVTRGTLAEGARLEIDTLPGQGWCLQCSDTIALSQLYDACPCCGSYQIQVTGGTEMRVKELAVD